MKRSWLTLYEIMHYDKFGNQERVESRWNTTDSLEDARAFVADLQQTHNDGGRCHGTSVACTIVRVTEESLT